MSETTTTAEIGTVFSFTKGALFGVTVYADRKQGKNGLTKGRKVGTIVDQTLPGVLRSVADLVEQQGGDFDGLVQVMESR